MTDFYKWHEDSSYRNLFNAEISVLKRGLGGDFKLFEILDSNETGGKVIAIGELSFSESGKQAIQIVFPTKYPFTAPRITPVDLLLNEDGSIVKPLQVKLFGKGNQYGNGELCLFRTDSWNSQEHNIGWVLRRSQKWLVSVHSEAGFKPEEIVEEYPAPLGHIGQVLLPSVIQIPAGVNTGEMQLAQFKPNHYILVDNALPNSPFRLQVNNESFKWYQFAEGITFKKLFPSLDGPTIYNVFKSHFGENITEGSQVKNVALYLPSDDNNWHFFKLVLSQRQGGVNIQCLYFLGRVISEELYLRTSSIFDDLILKKKRVTVIGVGAIGSEVCRSLARNGVGHFDLFDNDTFEVGNLVRHGADLFHIGDKKVDAVKQLIQKSNPNITVNGYHLDVLNDVGFIEKSLSKSDICIVLTGEDSVDYLFNDIYCPKYNIPFIFARVAAGGVSGAIQMVKVNETACLRCLSKQALDYLPLPKTSNRYTELKPEYGSCSLPALPGSEIDTKEIALQVSRISLQMLLESEQTNYAKLNGHQFYWHGPYGSKNQLPFTWEIKKHSKIDDCKVCG